MVRRSESNPIDRDERLGEAIEAYLAEAEEGSPPDPDSFAARYPDLSEDLRAALDGLALVRGIVGEGSGPGRALESGRRIAGYKIVRELGRGGMGTVYEAVHVGLDRPVALKVLGMHAAPDSNGRRRFLNEARTAAGLHHTHIVPVFDVGQVGGLCYYAMQRIEGSGLDRVIRHLRRTRPPGPAPGPNGPAGSPATPWDGPGAGTSSSFSSRIGRLCIRVASGWLGWQPRPVPQAPGGAGTGRDGPGAPVSEARSGPGGIGIGVMSFNPGDDSTASWSSRRREGKAAEPRRRPGSWATA